MWAVKGNNIEMTEGDWGVTLPITVSVGATITSSDQFKVSILDGVKGASVVEKTYSNISDSKINFALTAAESAKLKPRSYVWKLDWYQSGSFKCNLIPQSSFKVVQTA